jgi:hypothetical protein
MYKFSVFSDAAMRTEKRLMSVTSMQ